MYRIVVADSHSPRDGRFIEILGHYNPLTEPTTFEFKEDRVRVWLERGAQPTDRVARLLSARGIVPAPAYVVKPTPATA
jgi:small subunit ribosomal protein S16